MSTKESLADILRRKHTQHQRDAEEGQQVKDQWLREIQNLLDRIRKWLQEAEREGTVRIEPHTVGPAYEERLGSYRFPMLVLRVAEAKIEVTPRAKIIVGGEGRVDITCGIHHRVVLIQTSPDEWHIARHSPSFVLAPFTEESFKEIIEQIS